jgi:hypothetical protein
MVFDGGKREDDPIAHLYVIIHVCKDEIGVLASCGGV